MADRNAGWRCGSLGLWAGGQWCSSMAGSDPLLQAYTDMSVVDIHGYVCLLQVYTDMSVVDIHGHVCLLQVYTDISGSCGAGSYDVVLGADVVYDRTHAEWLPPVIKALLQTSGGA